MAKTQLQGVTRGYKGLQRVNTDCYKALQKVTGGYKGLQL